MKNGNISSIISKTSLVFRWQPRPNRSSVYWNRFDFVIVLMSIIEILLVELNDTNVGGMSSSSISDIVCLQLCQL